MDYDEAKMILSDVFTNVDDDSVKCSDQPVDVERGDNEAYLHGAFTTDQLEALAVWMRGEIATVQIGEFESDAREIQVDGSLMTAVWSDGVMLSADNGKSPMMTGMTAHCDFKLESGKRYRVTVAEIK